MDPDPSARPPSDTPSSGLTVNAAVSSSEEGTTKGTSRGQRTYLDSLPLEARRSPILRRIAVLRDNDQQYNIQY